MDPQHRQLQPRSAGQLPLPVIAPHPIQHELQEWPGLKPFSAEQSCYAEPYNRPFNSSIYTQGDLPPQVLQQIAPRDCSLDTSPVIPETDTFGVRHTGLQPQHGVHHPDRDSGIDVSYPELPSEWSHSSNSSTLVPGSFSATSVNHGTLPNEVQDRVHAPSYPNMTHPPRTSSLQSKLWQYPKTEPESDQFSSSYHPPAVRDQIGPSTGSKVKPKPGIIRPEPQGYGQSNGR